MGANCRRTKSANILRGYLEEKRRNTYVEDDSENGNETSDTKVDPLDSLERTTVRADVFEDDLSSEDGSNDGADSLDGLGKLETELGPPGRTTDSNVRVGGHFES